MFLVGFVFFRWFGTQVEKDLTGYCAIGTAPVVTSGPYYEEYAHPIRSNIAEYEPGLLSVRLSLRYK